MEYSLVLAGDDLIDPHHLPAEIGASHEDSLGKITVDFPDLLTLEKRYIDLVLESVGNNKKKAAKILGLSTTTLWRRLK